MKMIGVTLATQEPQLILIWILASMFLELKDRTMTACGMKKVNH